MPLIEIARTKTKDEALAALDSWRTKYEEVAKNLKPADVLLDGMHGPSSIWYRGFRIQAWYDGKRGRMKIRSCSSECLSGISLDSSLEVGKEG